ncbi:MAG: NADPH-dependent glutamate synthase [Deltaproteobacteria bacterium]|nr:MAG: NADPH-dependent glutamate synthase [Deltaproteobacteria bacterium]
MELTAKERMAIERHSMAEQPPEVRNRNFEEVPYGLTPEEAVAEAQRCLSCNKMPCVSGCPVEVPIPEFIVLVAEEKFAEAARLIKTKNVLPAVCGRVCPQETQCEGVCLRGKKDQTQAVAIGNLERFVADYERDNNLMEAAAIPDKNRFKIVIVGSGPSGLTVAGDLVQLGYEVTIYEAFHRGGGVLVYGIPEFRLPKKIVESEISALENSGVKINYNSVIGRLRTVDDLFNILGFNAVYIGVGAGLPIFLDIPGMNLNGVFSANEYLTRSNLMKSYLFPHYKTPMIIGKKVAVLGGGNVAMDSARTAIRLGAEKVTIVYRRAREQMPARAAEVHHAEEEKIEFRLLSSPVEIYGNEDGWVTSMKCQRYELGEPDESGRQRPVPIEGSFFEFDCDQVLVSIGGQANPLITKTTPDMKVNKWGYIEVDDWGRTSKRYVYAGGDIVTGAATVISAMGAGRRAAKAIHEDLTKESNETVTPDWW